MKNRSSRVLAVLLTTLGEVVNARMSLSELTNRHRQVAGGGFMKRVSLVAVLFLSAAAAGCSSQSPVAPSASPGVAAGLFARPGSGAPGEYQLSFVHRGQSVERLIVGQELGLKARVLNATTGLPATDGTVTFQYCSRPGRKNNILDADEAPKVECDEGSARWATVVSVQVNQNGEAFGGFGIVQIPRTIGFRFVFRPEKSGIASGTSQHLDFTWVPAP